MIWLYLSFIKYIYMKNLVLLVSFLLSLSTFHSQTNLSVEAPANTGATTQLRAPNGTAAHTTVRGHIIVTAAEMAGIPSGTVINGLGFLYSAGADVPASGNIQFYMENTADATNLKSTTWATAISTMTQVYNGTYTVPNVAGPTNVSLSTGFTYTGGGVYVAYDYLGTTFSATPATYLCNNLLGGGVKVSVSATTTPPVTLTASSGFRPSLVFSFPNPFTNNIRVDGVFAGKGEDNLLLGNTQSIQSSITNISSGALTNVLVSLNVTGANPFTTTQTVAALGPGATALVNFTGVPKTNTGAQTIVVSVPPDQQTSNDSWTISQNVYCDTVGYSFGDSISGGLGYNTGTGILANLLVVPSGPAIYVKKVVPTISIGTAVIGKDIKGVLLNSAGVIIDSTATYTITAADQGQKVELTFLNGGINHAGDSIYYGFRQVANAVGYFPLATQEVSGYVPADIFCGFDAFGGGYANYTTFGVFMIGAILAPFDMSTTALPTGICSGSPLTVTATPGLSSYNFFVNGTSVQNGPGLTYTHTPTANTVVQVNASVGSCAYSDSDSIAQILPINTGISAGLCAGSTYNFNGQVLTATGTYIDTLVGAAGCDSIVTLTLSITSFINNSISASICPGSTYTFGTQVLSTGGIYIDTLASSTSCDSVVTLTLTVNSTSSYNFSDVLCTGTTYTFGSQTLTSPGTYTQTLTNAAGCDSTVTLTLVGGAPSSGSLSATICPGTSYFFGGIPRTTAGTYTNIIQNAAGCDSVVTLTLSLHTAPTVSVTVSGSQLTATATPAGSTYQWVSCPSFFALVGKTNPIFQPSALTGEYAVIVTSPQGCKDTSACTFIDQTSLEELNPASAIILYPNPTINSVNLISEAGLINSYAIYDLKGRLVSSEKLIESKETVTFTVEGLDSGSYTVEVITDYGIVRKSFVKN
jgi:Secretion system C-terminal sorting domain